MNTYKVFTIRQETNIDKSKSNNNKKMFSFPVFLKQNAFSFSGSACYI